MFRLNGIILTKPKSFDTKNFFAGLLIAKSKKSLKCSRTFWLVPSGFHLTGNQYVVALDRIFNTLCEPLLLPYLVK